MPSDGTRDQEAGGEEEQGVAPVAGGEGEAQPGTSARGGPPGPRRPSSPSLLLAILVGFDGLGRRLRSWCPLPGRGLEQVGDLHPADEPGREARPRPRAGPGGPPATSPRSRARPYPGVGAGRGRPPRETGRTPPRRPPSRRAPPDAGAVPSRPSPCRDALALRLLAVALHGYGGTRHLGAPVPGPRAATTSSGLPSGRGCGARRPGCRPGPSRGAGRSRSRSPDTRRIRVAGRQLPLLGQVSDPAQILVDDLVALDTHAVRRYRHLHRTRAVLLQHRPAPSARPAIEDKARSGPERGSGGAAPGDVHTDRPAPTKDTAPHPPANVGGMSTEETPAPRTLADALRARRRRVARRAAARPSGPLTPVPTDLTQLATRAGTRASVVRALERLDRFTLQTAEALAVAPDPAAYGDSAGPPRGRRRRSGRHRRAAPRSHRAARAGAGVGRDDRLRLVRTARELLAPSPQHPSPTGLGPTVAEATAGMSPGRVQEIVAAAGLTSTHDAVSAVTSLTACSPTGSGWPRCSTAPPPDSVDVLRRLVWGPPYGQVTAEPGRTPALAAGPGAAPAHSTRHRRAPP